MTKPNIQLILLISALSFTIMGCGSSKTKFSGQVDSSSRSGTGVQAECNKFQSTHASGVVFNYYNVSNAYVADRLRLELTSVSSDLVDASKKLNLSFQGYGYDSNNKLVRTSTPFYFNLEFRPGGQGDGDGKDVLSTDTRGFSADDFNGLTTKLRSTYGVATSSIQTTLKYFDFVLRGTSATYDVLQVVITNTSTVTASSTDLLMTPFSLNSDTYAAEHPSNLLALHPFGSIRGKSDDWYSTQGASLCDN